MTFNYQLGSMYSFSTFDPTYLGNDYTNVKLLAIMDADTANRNGLDIYSSHAIVYPSIPDPVKPPNDPTQYNYIQIATQAGDRVILGMAWIDETTITSAVTTSATAVIGNVTVTDLPKIKQILAMGGYNNLALTLNTQTTQIGS